MAYDLLSNYALRRESVYSGGLTLAFSNETAARGNFPRMRMGVQFKKHPQASSQKTSNRKERVSNSTEYEKRNRRKPHTTTVPVNGRF